jgi:branched-chain amino acid transport system permease protein
MSTTTTTTADAPVRRASPPRESPVRIAIIAALYAFVLFGLPPLLSTYWTDVVTAVAIYSVVALGLNMLMGRVGLVSLGQIAVLALGAWVSARLLFGTGLPFPIVLLLAGLITMVLGSLIGLPALRLSGLYLALITLMLAGSITVALTTTNFPNGGHGFLGHTDTDLGSTAVRRPAIAQTDPAYYRYCAIVAGLMFLLALWHVRSKPGRAWAAIRQSEPAALAAGVNITLYKMWAFALASFMTGVAGGLLAANVSRLYTFQFSTRESILLLAVVLMGGIYSIWGAIVAGAFMRLQVLLTAPAGLAAQFPKDMAKLGGLLARLVGRGRPAHEAAE